MIQAKSPLKNAGPFAGTRVANALLDKNLPKRKHDTQKSQSARGIYGRRRPIGHRVPGTARLSTKSQYRFALHNRDPSIAFSRLAGTAAVMNDFRRAGIQSLSTGFLQFVAEIH